MDQYGLIGYPLKHSFSMSYFNDKFAAEQIDAEYVNFEIPSIREFKAIIKNHPNLKGLNVTIPYKEQVIPYLNQLNENAKMIGAVNVIKIERSKGKIKKLTGFNSDIIGFKKSLEPLLHPQHKKALVLGTGGSAKAIYYGLQQLGITPTYVAREKESNALTYDELNEHDIATHTIIVNCTPVGMWPHVDERPKIPYEYLTSEHLLYDLLYNPNETLFMKSGAEQGATVKNGLEMLLLQAFASWEFWQN